MGAVCVNNGIPQCLLMGLFTPKKNKIILRTVHFRNRQDVESGGGTQSSRLTRMAKQTDKTETDQRVFPEIQETTKAGKPEQR